MVLVIILFVIKQPLIPKLGSGPKTRDPMPRLNVKEDVEEMFDGQDLSEEFKENAATLFEAAVSARLIALKLLVLRKSMKQSYTKNLLLSVKN
jgi:hypothetical protein